MKNFYSLIITVLLTANLIAQVPQKFSYQAIIRNSNNTLIINQTVGMQISILQGSVIGTAVYTEVQTPTTNANGLISIEIGGGAGFNAIDWANDSYFIKTETDPNGGTNYTIRGTSQLLSVPYALYAKTSETADYNSLSNKPALFDGAWNSLSDKPVLALVATSGSYNDLTNKPAGNNVGDMQYWNGTNWTMVPVGLPGQFLQLNASSIPAWSGASYPTITTTALSDITSSSATSGGNIIHDGGAAVTARGVCWSTTSNPTIVNSKTTDGAGSGTFTSPITGLTLGVTYYVRAYATNNSGTAYGNEISFTTTLGIGDSYQGGKVAYIYKPGDLGYIEGQIHGIIAAPSDLSTNVAWWNGSYTTTGATAIVVGTGYANTVAIVNSQGAGSYAAKLCYDFVLNGYDDWYLPSLDEVFHGLFENQTVIGGFSIADYYWSSTEGDSGTAFLVFFYSPWVDNVPKEEVAKVRAVRSF